MQSTERFTDRVDDYVRHRPTYPAALIPLLQRELGLAPAHAVADLGSGTGLSAQPFLALGCRVYGVEPNGAMREAGERFLAAYPRFTSVAGTAEETTLPASAVDFVVAGQAFHWFDHPRTRAEVARILRPGGAVILVWNTWHQETSPLMSTYRDIVHRYANDSAVEERHSQERLLASIAAFFAPAPFTARVLENDQSYDFEGLMGRVRSASYNPKPGHEAYAAQEAELRAMFDRHQTGGRITFEMKTQVFFGAPK